MPIAQVNGLALHYAEHGDGAPLVLLHGGIGASEMFATSAPALAANRRIITVDLQGSGATADVDRPLRPELLAEDVAQLLEHLGLAEADVLGYSLGGMAALRLAIQRPERVRRLVLASVPARRDAWFPEVLAGMDAIGPAAARMMTASPMYQHYVTVAPRPEDWEAHVVRTGEFLRSAYDWTAEVATISAPTLLIYADADSIRPAHMVEMFGLLGGGLRDADLDGSGRPPGALAVLPATSHYDLLESPLLVPAVLGFLDA